MMSQLDLTRLKDYFEAKLAAEVQVADVVDAVEKGDSDLLLVDLRGRETYAKGHIPGALSMLVDEIDKRYKELPRDKRIVTYCYSQHCHLSTLAALKLVGHGIPAKEMNVGWKEWVASGYPVQPQLK